MKRLTRKKISALPFFVFALLFELFVTTGTNNFIASAQVLSNNNCRLRGANNALSFGNLDPANPIDVTTNITVIFRCGGRDRIATFLITDDDGLYESGPNNNRMRHTSQLSEFLAYSLTLSPVTGSVPRRRRQTLTITGTVSGLDYQSAYMGDYSDTVLITINP